MSSIKLKDILETIITESTEEKTYEVEYSYRYGKDGDDTDFDTIEVKATSEADAVKKAKEKARRLSIQSSFKAKLKNENKVIKEGLLNNFSDYETVFEMARHKAIPFAMVGMLLVKYGIAKAKELLKRGKEEVMDAIEDSPKQDLDTTPTKQRIKLFKKKDNKVFNKFLDNIDN